jgi:hypothetical protein
MSDITPARKLFDLLISRDFDPEMLDATGRPAQDPSETEIFSFDFRAESGKDYGTVVIMLGDDNNIEVYCSDNVGRSMEGTDKNNWFEFLSQLKNFATRNFMSFGIKNLNRLRYSMQGQAAIKEGLFESWSGKRDVSWNAGATESRLMIKHKRSLGEGEARFRYVESLFIETAEGERYKLPFRNLTAGKAMLEHVRMGGRPYDERGQHIAEMVTELSVLSRFRRANQGRLLEGDAAVLVEKTQSYHETLKQNLKGLTTRTGYSRYFESWNPATLTEESMVIDGLKHLFVTQSIDQRIEDALPLIAKIQQQENTMKESEIFEAWANQLMEGTWQTPDTPEKQAKLIELLSTDLPVGADATNATEQLYDLLGDDELFDQLQDLADADANADARQIVLNRMQELSDDPDVMKVITSLNIDATAVMNPPEQTPADLDSESDDQSPVQETEYPEYAQDLSSILKHAGVPAQERPAPDYEPEVLETANPGVTPADIDGAPKQELDEFAPLATAVGSALGRAAVGMAAKSIANKMSGNDELDEEWYAHDFNQWQSDANAKGLNIVKSESNETGNNLQAFNAVDSSGSTVGHFDGNKGSGILTNTPAEYQQAVAVDEGFSQNANDAYTKDVVGYSTGASAAKELAKMANPLDEATCNMTEAGEHCDKHGMEECWANKQEPTALQGQYGHSGRMKEVGKDSSFLDRLKELSGMIRN